MVRSGTIATGAFAAAVPRGPCELVVVEGPDRGLRVPIGDRPIVVGSEPGCEMVLADPRVSDVIALTRRALNVPSPSRVRLRNPVVDFDALPETAEVWAADSVICTLGTTRKLAGSEAAFRKGL